MKFMVTWTIAPENYKAAVKRFITNGAPMPKGMKSLGRWHTAGSTRGFHLVEGSEAAIAEDSAQWADLLDLQVVPVVEDDVAGAIGAKILAKK